jgi:hypothetical protein
LELTGVVMSEADFIHIITQNRQVYGLYSVGYGLLSLTALIAAYLLRNTPLWFRSLAAAITVFQIFVTFTGFTAVNNGFFTMMTELSKAAASGGAPMINDVMIAAGSTPGQPFEAPSWAILGLIAMLIHAAGTVYLFTMAKWEKED